MQAIPKEQMPEQVSQKAQSSQSDDKKLTKEELKSFVEEQVIAKLGKPSNLNFIRASNVFNNRWRVDVWCYHKVEGCISEQSCSMIDHSYFIHTDEHGKITKSDPEINKEY